MKATDGRLVVKGAVQSLIVVSPDPRTERLVPVLRGLVDSSVCPFAEHCLDEPFGFAVRSWSIRSGTKVANLDAFAMRSPRLGNVTGAVVGHYPLDGDPVGSEPSNGAIEKPNTSIGFLVWQNFDVSGPAGVVDTYMDGFPSGLLAAGSGASAPGHSMAGLVETAEFFDVDMDQLTGVTPAVSVRWFRRFELGKAVQPNPFKDERHRREWHVQFLCDLRTGHSQPPQRLDDLDSLGGCSCWRVVWAR